MMENFKRKLHRLNTPNLHRDFDKIERYISTIEEDNLQLSLNVPSFEDRTRAILDKYGYENMMLINRINKMFFDKGFSPYRKGRLNEK